MTDAPHTIPYGSTRSALLAALFLVLSLSPCARATAQSAPLVVSAQFDYFLVDGQPRFLTFFSYFDAMRASDATLDSDLAYLSSKGFGGLRIFANWWAQGVTGAYATDTLFDSAGVLRQTRLDRLRTVLTRARSFGLVVDLTFSCDTVQYLSPAGYQAGVVAAANALAGDAYRHVVFDLQNEGDYVSCRGIGSPMTATESQDLRNAVKAADPLRYLMLSWQQTSSTGDTVAFANARALDVVAYHEPRGGAWYARTAAVVSALRAATNCPAVIAQTALAPGTTTCKPIYLQEPDYTAPSGADYLTAVSGAKSAGAAAWTFHTEKAFRLDNGPAYLRFSAAEQFFANQLSQALQSTAWETDDVLDTWRMFHGVTGPAAADQDGDGISNSSEFIQGTHPTAPAGLVRYFAEGNNGTFFATRIALFNPGAQPASVLVRAMKDDGAMTSTIKYLPAYARDTVDMTKLQGLREMGFATVIESNVRVAADRTLSWDRATGYGSSLERQILSPSATWYFAEGVTSGSFDTYFTLFNPSDTPMSIQGRYLGSPGSTPVLRTYTVPARRRLVVAADGDPLLTALGSFAALFASPTGALFLAERGTYLTSEGRAFNAGSVGSGVGGASLDWYFAEGATGGFFDCYLLLANPYSVDALLQITYTRPDAQVVMKTYTVAAASRMAILVDAQDSLLSDTNLWTRVHSLNGVGVLAERTMWWPQTSWAASHNSQGETSAWPAWAFAEGETGNGVGASTYVVLANAGAGDTVRVQVFLEGGGTASQDYWVPSGGRLSLDMASAFPITANRRFATTVRALNGAPLVVERSIYRDAGGVGWASGATSYGTRVP